MSCSFPLTRPRPTAICPRQGQPHIWAGMYRKEGLTREALLRVCDSGWPRAVRGDAVSQPGRGAMATRFAVSERVHRAAPCHCYTSTGPKRCLCPK